jgi:thiamine biosynthesis lipoprotein
MPLKVGRQLSRRDFIRIVAIGGGAAALSRFGLRGADSAHTVTESRIHLGTVIDLTVVGDDPEQSRAAISSAFTCIEALENVLSRFIPASDVSILNRAGLVASPRPEFVQVLQLAAETSLATGGAFDVTVKPLVDAYESRFRRGEDLPETPEIQRLLGLVGWRRLSISNQSVKIQMPGMGVSLDGIAKGYIVDEAVEQLRQAGYTNVLVEAGGDLLALGVSGRNAPWEIGVLAPRAGMGDLLTRIEVENKAIATSGDYLQTYSPDFTKHHIVNPKTGYSSPYLASATVMAPSCWQADAFATALMVMDVEEGLALVRHTREIEAILVTKDRRILSTLSATSA